MSKLDPQSFAEPSALKAHVSSTHREGENEFPCEFCGKVRTTELCPSSETVFLTVYSINIVILLNAGD